MLQRGASSACSLSPHSRLKKACWCYSQEQAKTPHPLLANVSLSNFLGKLQPTGENYPTCLNTLSRSWCCHLPIFLLARKELFSCRQTARQNCEQDDASPLKLLIHTSSLVQKLSSSSIWLMHTAHKEDWPQEGRDALGYGYFEQFYTFPSYTKKKEAQGSSATWHFHTMTMDGSSMAHKNMQTITW